jgi:amino acid adenylation domain-containing protein/thioester reductase-like protein
MEAMLAELRHRNIRLAADGDQLRVEGAPAAMDEPLRHALSEHKAALLAMLRQQADAPPALLGHDAQACGEPFPLTPLQRAYWLGRDAALEGGGVATHLYIEFACYGRSVEALEEALARLIDRHGMLRAVVDVHTGQQRVLPQVPRYRIAVADAREAPAAEGLAMALATREALSHQVLAPDRWPLFDIRATLLQGGELRLHVSLDLLMLDGSSIHLFFTEWRALLERRPLPPPPAIGFRDVVLAREAARQGPAAAAARRYWEDRLPALPPAPPLPWRAGAFAPGVVPRFTRRALGLEAARWSRLKRTATRLGLSPSSLVLAAYGDVLARWSRSARFTVAVTTGFRDDAHPDVPRMLGDFTAVVLHALDRSEPAESLLAFAQRQQRRLVLDLQHRGHDGMDLRRSWARHHGLPAPTAMPVVFSSGIGWGGEEGWNLEQLGRCTWAISQTSQVGLDCHATELHGSLVLAWDAVEAAFEDGVLDAMFQSFTQLVESLAEWAEAGPAGEGAISGSGLEDTPTAGSHVPSAELPPAMQRRREQANRTEQELPPQALHAGLVQQALQRPDDVALVAGGRRMRFGEWLGEAAAVADRLRADGVSPGEPVAVVMRKGWEQAVAVLGVLLAGAAYLPVDADLPPLRLQALLQSAGVRHVVARPEEQPEEQPAGQPEGPLPALQGGPWTLQLLQRGRAAPWTEAHAQSLQAIDRPAYLIFTSGSTGLPKCVLMHHRAAANTVLSVNRLLDVGPGDAVLGLSSLGFDLSVYDLFGVPGAGGRLVLPEAARLQDPLHWAELMQQHGITLWNSAPQWMRMLLDSQAAGAPLPGRLRAALLSGDFMPLDTLARLRGHHCAARLLSLGGATEAAIWSVWHEVQAVDPRWRSIPYGQPLPNQQAWVLDSRFRPTPDQVRGRIFIAGAGLAEGYLGDPARTAERFIRHPVSGQRLYDTGDIGCYAESGDIIILGRDDRQIKVRGHRVELGEIEATLLQHPNVRQAVVRAIGEGDGAELPLGARQLAAYVEWSGKQGQCAAAAAADVDGNGGDGAALKHFLAERLPEHMVPRHVVLLDRMPVSANGKIDAQALPPPAQADGDAAAPEGPRSDTERGILQVWSRVLPGVDIGVTDNFFDRGGDSVLATTLLRELNAALPLFRLEMHEIFENMTIESMAALYLRRQQESPQHHRPTARKKPGVDRIAALAEHDKPAMLADVEAAQACIAAIDLPGRESNVAAPRELLLTGATGWIGPHVLGELLGTTRALIHCLVRSDDKAKAHSSLIDQMRQRGITIEPGWADRVQAVLGDLDRPQFGLPDERWEALCHSVDAIYHLGASLNILANPRYAKHRQTNVAATLWLARLAMAQRLKPVFFLSPMTVGRRHRDGRFTVLHQETAHDADGLMTGYAQSKWAAEQVLLAAAARGLPMKIYRCSHALPSAHGGHVKETDTYVNLLRVACRVALVPDWEDSRLNGVPVDVLAKILVGNSLAGDDHRGIVHIDNRDPLDLKSIIGLLLPNGSPKPCVPRQQWLTACQAVAAEMPGVQGSLANLLFAHREGDTSVERMFHAHPLDLGYFSRRGEDTRLAQLTPPAYWHMLRRQLGAMP